MGTLINASLAVLILGNLVLLGSSRIYNRIRVVAVQGAVIGVLTVLAQMDALSWNVMALAAAIILLKGFLFPWFFRRIANRVNVRQEVEPFVPYTLSVFAGLGCLLVSIWMGSKLPHPASLVSPMALPAALATILSGFFLIIARRKALNQVLGYLAAENGIYAFGVALVGEGPLLVELAMLLDLFVAVFIMGIAIHHISSEFDSIDTSRIAELKE